MNDLEMLKEQRKKIKEQISIKSKAIHRIRSLASKYSLQVSEMRNAHDILDRKIFIQEKGITVVTPKMAKRKYNKKPQLSLEEQIDQMSGKELRELITSLERKKSVFDGQTKTIIGASISAKSY